PLVLLLARDLLLRRDVAPVDAHVAAVDGAHEAVTDHHVLEHTVTHAVSEAPLPDDVGSIAHALHAARRNDTVVATANHGVGQRDCPHSGAADTIDGLGSDGPVETDAESN